MSSVDDDVKTVIEELASIHEFIAKNNREKVRMLQMQHAKSLIAGISSLTPAAGIALTTAVHDGPWTQEEDDSLCDFIAGHLGKAKSSGAKKAGSHEPQSITTFPSYVTKEICDVMDDKAMSEYTQMTTTVNVMLVYGLGWPDTKSKRHIMATLLGLGFGNSPSQARTKELLDEFVRILVKRRAELQWKFQYIVEYPAEPSQLPASIREHVLQTQTLKPVEIKNLRELDDYVVQRNTHKSVRTQQMGSSQMHTRGMGMGHMGSMPGSSSGMGMGFGMGMGMPGMPGMQGMGMSMGQWMMNPQQLQQMQSMMMKDQMQQMQRARMGTKRARSLCDDSAQGNVAALHSAEPDDTPDGALPAVEDASSFWSDQPTDTASAAADAAVHTTSAPGAPIPPAQHGAAPIVAMPTLTPQGQADALMAAIKKRPAAAQPKAKGGQTKQKKAKLSAEEKAAEFAKRKAVALALNAAVADKLVAFLKKKHKNLPSHSDRLAVMPGGCPRCRFQSPCPDSCWKSRLNL
jgi:hypothetical protein